MDTLLRFQIPVVLVAKVKSIAAQANVDVHTVVEIALERYFSQGPEEEETLAITLQKLSDDCILAALAYR
ncbi:MAG: hypothetical protein M3160_05280 [Candidatus Eremiobacteraeota bacterium]|nr:hypothetical protein [Candidatus Eremiobacteraeota bacterium]